MPRLLVTSVLSVALSACGARQPMDTAWVMPDLRTGEPPGDPFARAGAGANAASGDLPRGDHPEMAFVSSDGFWRVDERRALREAQATGRGLFVEVYAEWSEASRRLEDEVLGDVEVRAAILERYVPLRLDVTEETMAGRDQLERYRVERLPALLLFGPDGVEQTRIGELIGPEDLIDRITSGGQVR